MQWRWERPLELEPAAWRVEEQRRAVCPGPSVRPQGAGVRAGRDCRQTEKPFCDMLTSLDVTLEAVGEAVGFYSRE